MARQVTWSHSQRLALCMCYQRPPQRALNLQKLERILTPPTACLAEGIKDNGYLHMESTVRRWQCAVSKCGYSVQRNTCLALRTSTSASFSSKMFLHHQVFPNNCHPRRYASTQPTTAYEVILASKPVQLCQAFLEGCHDVTGLPWWASIIVSTLMLRAVLTFPLGIYTQYIRAKVERLQPEIVMMAKQAFVRRYAERAKLEGWTEKRAELMVMRLVKHYSKELFIRDNCHPAKGSILLLVQLPLWICLSLALRNMTGAFAGTIYLDPANIVPSLSTEGALWFSNLTIADPFVILPITVGLLNLCNIEMMSLHRNPVSRTQRYVSNFLRGMSLVMIPIAAYVPTAMTLYWACSAFYGLGQNILLKSPTARSVLKIPSAPSDSKTPYRDMADLIKTRYLGRREEGEEGKKFEEVMEEDAGDKRGKQSSEQEKGRTERKVNSPK